MNEQGQFASPTPKIADSEYSNDGITLKPGARASARSEARA